MPGLIGSRRWEVLPHDVRTEHKLAADLGVPSLVARVLAARGMDGAQEVRRFLSPNLSRDWCDPLEIPGMGAACDRVAAALASGEQIAVFGDFDVDGMSATALLTLALRRLGGKVEPYIPHRFGEGYGLTREALARVRRGCDPALVVTVDNGIAAAREVEWLVKQGVDVVITDHHEPGDLVPVGVPVTDPKLSATCASRELAGAGVALKMVCELGRRLGTDGLWRDYVDLAMLGTVSDMMLLTGENRSLVADGIARLRCGMRPGIVALAAAAGTDLASITADALPFSLVPRLNAAGRMGTTDVAFELLMTDDPARAAELAASLEQTNSERREIESQLTDAAVAQAEATFDGGRSVVVAGEGWHEGVKGIVASRLVSRYHVPSIVFTIEGDVARGSGRSVGTVDLFHAVGQCSDTLVRFGGHEGAVGVTCETRRLPEFRERLEEALRDLPAEQFEVRGEVAALVELRELSVTSIASLDRMQPFGQGNKKPLFGVCGVSMRSRACVGAGGNHLRFTATDGMTSVPAIMFRAPDIERAASCEEVVDLVFEAVNETWQGRTKPKLMVRDILYRDAPRAAEGAEGPAAHAAAPADEAVAASRRGRYRRLEADALTDELRRQMIGDNELLPAQRSALDRLADGRSTLAVMATGRGKSLIFHIHAAREAIRSHCASVFVYPLRALVGDQAHHLKNELAELGMKIAVLTGETPAAERESTYAALADGTVDVVLTTPEYLAIHASRLAAGGRVGFVVIDEAHHAGTAKSGARAAYLELPRVLGALGNPVALAVTATASTDVAREICRLAGIDEHDVLVDRSVRANLALSDRRSLRDRDAFVAHVVATGDKCVIYVNSRAQSVSLTRTLRRAIPELGERIAFYNAAMSRADRLAVERAFRGDALSCIVSTSAFGEGVNLPDIRNVVLYHMPFGRTEFNQMSGRAGRDGKPATIHLAYGADDARINEAVLAAATPDRAGMAAVYRALRGISVPEGGAGAPFGDAAVASLLAGLDPRLALTTGSIEAALAVFAELGFLEVDGYGEGRRVRMAAHPAHVDLASSLRYAEGMLEREAFVQFRDWALSSDPKTLLAQINTPIVPSFGHVVDE